MEIKELNKIAERLQVLENNELLDAGLKNINGGFSIIDMYDYDENFIYVEIKWGVQCGGESDYCYSENGKLDRLSLEWI
tara:strand:+ start:1378 stop:1614 length:237 start_codon:yes stop_codon:yes gene_type:complete